MISREESADQPFVIVIENFTWLILFTILFGGLSFAISKALLCHLFSIPISWSTTGKEVSVVHTYFKRSF